MKDIFFLLIIFIFVIGLAYFITKKLASLGTLRMQGKNMKILETIQIGMNQHIHLIEVGDKMFIIGVSKENICYLSEVDDKSIDLSLYQMSNKTPSFEQYLRKWTQKKNDSQ